MATMSSARPVWTLLDDCERQGRGFSAASSLQERANAGHVGGQTLGSDVAACRGLTPYQLATPLTHPCQIDVS